MNYRLSQFYEAANFFVWHPERAWAIAAIFFVLFVGCFVANRCVKWSERRVSFWPLLVSAVGWTIFGLMELSCKIEKADIRIDLFVSWLAILGITTVCCIWWGVSILTDFCCRKVRS